MASSSKNPISSFYRGSAKERSKGSQAMEYHPPFRSNGKLVVKIPEEVRNKGIAEWADCLVGQFFSAAPDCGVVRSTVNMIWGKDCSVDVTLAGNDTFIFKFSNLETRDWVLRSEPWHVGYKPLKISKWMPGMQFKKKQFSRIPIWVKLQHVPMEFVTGKGLSCIATAIGNPLNLDKATAKRGSQEFLEICVQIDVDSKLPDVVKVEIGDGKLLEIVVEYPWKPAKCINCKVFGHATDKCSKHKEWKKGGNKHENPFGEGCSKNSERNNDVFRLYFKGLVSKEKVGNEERVLAGIGVAICNSKDDLIFEVRKSLIGNGMSRQAAEIKALIEGLNASLALDLKNITFYCDYYPLYKFVTGRWPPKQRKIAMLSNQVSILKRKFMYCNPTFVARNDIKFAFKLAREAIVSEINRSAAPSHGKALKETCVICLNDTDAGRVFSIDGCMHRYCFSCMKQHMEVKLLHGMVPKCPHEGCKSELIVDSCRKFLTPKLIERFNQRIKEASIPAPEKVYCPYLRCSALMSKSEASEYAKDVFGDADRSGARKCMKCHGLFCINCRVPWHSNMMCDDYKKLNPNPLEEDVKLNSLATKKLWRQCVKCQHMIELSEGCYHMTCRCGYEFCYNCGAEWKDKNATCSCPLWVEDNIWHEDNRGSDDEEEEEDDFYDDEEDDFYDDEEDDFSGEEDNIRYEDERVSDDEEEEEDDFDEKEDNISHEDNIYSGDDEEEEEEEKDGFGEEEDIISGDEDEEEKDDSDQEDGNFSDEDNRDSGDDEEEGNISYEDSIDSGGEEEYDIDDYDDSWSEDFGYSDDEY